MNYKNFIRDRQFRLAILRLFSFVPDRIMIFVQYRIKTGHRLNLQNAKRYSEKIQYYKLNYRNQLMKQCVDKYSVRKYVKKCGYENILNPILGIHDSVDEIDFNSLPNQFVVKDTLGWGGTSVEIIEDKSLLDLVGLRNRINEWLRPGRKHPGREWVYEGRRNRILIDTYIPSDKNQGGLVDYKFLCFNGKVKYLYIIADRSMGNGAGLAIYDRDYNRLHYLRADERPLKRDIPKPDNYEEMVKCAEKLSEPFPHVRIDLYDQNEKIIFGEITFFDGSGYMKFEPDEFDYILGKEFDILNM